MKRISKLAVCLYCMCMVLCFLQTNAKADSTPTRDEAITWLRNQEGVWWDLDGAYGAQCSDFVSAYMNWLYSGVPNVNLGYEVYNADYYPTAASWNTDRWTIIDGQGGSPEPGDIFVTPGHVGVFLSGSKSSAEIIDQNSWETQQLADLYGGSGRAARIYNSSLSNATCFIRYRHFLTPPVAPGKPSVSVNGTSVTVSWNDVSNETSYNVYLLQSPWGWEDIKYSKTVSANVTSCTFTNVTPGDYAAFIISRPNADTEQSPWTEFNVAEPTVAVTKVTLNEPSLNLTVGETATLTATVLPSNATDKTVTWSSSKTSVATVSSSGKVTAKGAGTATITASAGGKSASCTVTVVKGEIAFSQGGFIDGIDSLIATVENSTNATAAVKLVMAVYNDGGKLLSTSVQEDTIGVGSTSFFFPVDSRESGRVYKVFCLDGNGAPLSAPLTVSENVTLSDWVLAENAPANAVIAQEKWTYDKVTDTKTTSSSNLSGWDLVGSSWNQTGSGTHYYASYPAGFSQDHTLYSKYGKSALQATETTSTKRTVSSASFATYIYWHWTHNMYELANNNYNVLISDQYEWDGGTEYYNFRAFESTTNYGQYDPNGAGGYDGVYYAWLDNPQDGSWWWFRFPVYKQTYTDYQKVYSYEKVSRNLESATAVTSSSTIRNVKHWVKYEQYDVGVQPPADGTVPQKSFTLGSSPLNNQVYSTEQFQAIVSGATADFYILTLQSSTAAASASNIRFVDQCAPSNKKLTFFVNPDGLANNATYYLYITGKAGERTLLTSFTYVSPVPEITTQPTNVTVTAGQTATFKVTANGATSYQWYYRTSSTGSWTAVAASSGKTSTYSLTTAARHNGYQYYCKVTNASGSVDSSVVTLTVNSKPVITTQPTNKTVDAGSTASFKVTATGATSYQWYYRTSSTGSWTAVAASSGKTATYSLTADARHNGYQYRCLVKNASGEVYTNTVTLTVNSKPVITTQPTSVTVTAGQTATFKVTAAGATSYQWYVSKDKGATWTEILNNSTSATYALATQAKHNGYRYYCKVTNAAGSVYSNTVTLTVNSKPVITTQPTNVTVTAGQTATFKVTATGATSYQWYYRTSSSGSWTTVAASSGKTSTYSLTAETRHNGYQYYCKVTNAAGSVISNTVTLTVSGKPQITEQPTSWSVTAGSTATFKVTATGATSYQWYYRTSSTGSWTAVAAASGKTSTYKLTAAARHDGYQYRCKVSNENGDVYTVIVTLVVT